MPEAGQSTATGSAGAPRFVTGDVRMHRELHRTHASKEVFRDVDLNKGQRSSWHHAEPWSARRGMSWHAAAEVRHPLTSIHGCECATRDARRDLSNLCRAPHQRLQHAEHAQRGGASKA